MIPKKCEKAIEIMIRIAKDKFRDNLKAVIMFGSGNDDGFINGISDLDFIYIFNNIDFNILQEISQIRKMTAKICECKVDIKPFSFVEFTSAIKGKGTFEFFNGWGLKMIKEGHQKIIYNSGSFSTDYYINLERIKSDSLERAHYYITKLRKIYSSEDKVILCGEAKRLDNLDKLKLTISAVKNILTFCLAYRGAFYFKTEDILIKSAKYFGPILEIENLFHLKESKQYKQDIAVKAYDRIEKIYKSTITLK